MSELTLADIAGEAIETACKSEKQQPVALVVLWAFAFACALVLYREGYAKRASSDVWTMHLGAVDQIWPDVQRGLQSYLRVCPDIGDFELPTKEDFFTNVVTSGLGVASDVRLVRKRELPDIFEALSERFGANLTNTNTQSVRLLLVVTKQLFSTVGTEDPGP
jgi:hypothetical protein